MAQLKLGGIDRPNEKVLARICSSYASELIVTIHSVDLAVSLYRRVRDMPTTFTKGIVRDQQGVSINGPFMPDKPKLLMGSHEDGRQVVVKLLFLDADDPRDIAVRILEISNEIQCCKDLASSDGNIALVQHEVVTLDVPTEMVGQTRRSGQFSALLMPQYVRSVARGPSFSKMVVTREARRILDALRYVHDRGYVHMDVKSDNVFYDTSGRWFLGDFGSACNLNSGAVVFSTTEVFYHGKILGQQAYPKYDWFMLLVMILIELENKDDWALKFIEEKHLKVSYDRVMAEAQRVIDNQTYPQDLRACISEIVSAYSSAETCFSAEA